jgi:hypothetical protein
MFKVTREHAIVLADFLAEMSRTNSFPVRTVLDISDVDIFN